MLTYEEALELLRKKRFNKKISFLSKKFKNKNIIIYGAGLLSQVILENYDLSYLNILAVADMKYIKGAQNEKFYGYKTISPHEINNYNPHLILLSIDIDVDRQNKVVDFLKNEISLDLNSIIIEPVLKDSMLRKILIEKTINFLKKTSISSEIIGPPKNYINSEEWINSGSKSAKKAEIIKFNAGGISKNTIKIFLHDKPYKFKHALYEYPHFKSYIVKIPDGRVYGEEATIITPDDKVLALESADVRIGNPELLPVFSKIKLPPVKKINGILAVLSTPVCYNYSHWVYDVLTRLILTKRAELKPDKYLVKAITPIQQESLALLGVSKDQIIINDINTHIKAKTLIVPSFLFEITKFKAQILREELLKFANNNEYPERIYISRRDALCRKIINEDEVVGMLEKYGFKVLELSSKTFVEQISLFSKAKFIVTPHGAALTNIVFCQPDTKIIEIISPDYTSTTFWNTSSCVGLDHHSLAGEKDNSSNLDARYKVRRNILVNIEKLAFIVEYILQEQDK